MRAHWAARPRPAAGARASDARRFESQRHRRPAASVTSPAPGGGHPVVSADMPGLPRAAADEGAAGQEAHTAATTPSGGGIPPQGGHVSHEGAKPVRVREPQRPAFPAPRAAGLVPAPGARAALARVHGSCTCLLSMRVFRPLSSSRTHEQTPPLPLGSGEGRPRAAAARAISADQATTPAAAGGLKRVRVRPVMGWKVPPSPALKAPARCLRTTPMNESEFICQCLASRRPPVPHPATPCTPFCTFCTAPPAA